MFGNRGRRLVLTGKIILMSTTFAELDNSPAAEGPSDQDRQAVAQLKSSTGGIKAELAKVIVGQEAVVDQVLIAILTRSHALLVGGPGEDAPGFHLVANAAFVLQTNSVHPRPDALRHHRHRGDLPGGRQRQTRVPLPERANFRNMILADEINR